LPVAGFAGVAVAIIGVAVAVGIHHWFIEDES
jgi:hypothetical protein